MIITGRWFPVIPLVAALVAVAWYGVRRWRLSRIVRRFQRDHGTGKDLLLVYTDSPHWKDYIETHWLSRWRDRAVTLNRSLPWSRSQSEAALWLAVKGWEEYNPLAVVISPNGKLRVIRLYSAFQDRKHGDDQALRAAEAELEAALT